MMDISLLTDSSYPSLQMKVCFQTEPIPRKTRLTIKEGANKVIGATPSKFTLSQSHHNLFGYVI